MFFRDGALNATYIGCYGDTVGYADHTLGADPLPLNVDFIHNQNLVTFLQERGVIALHKVVPWLDPCSDTFSVTRRGDTVRVPPFWNLLVLDYNPTAELNPVMESYYLMAYFYNDILYAEPVMKIYLGHGANNAVSSMPYTDLELFSAGDRKGGKEILQVDPFLSEQISISNSFDASGSPMGINAVNAWNYNRGSSDLKIGIIDDGVYTRSDHEFDNLTVKVSMISGQAHAAQTMAPHGTEMAGIFGALAENGTGIAGICGGNGTSHGCALLSFDVHDDGGRRFELDPIAVADALVIASLDIPPSGKGYGCDVINCSYYSPRYNFTIRWAAICAYLNSSILVACMGNEEKDNNHDFQPADAGDRYVLSIGGKDETFIRSNNSHYGENIDCMAPSFGRHMRTTVGWVQDIQPSGGMTSAAAAHVTGIAGLIATEYRNSGSNVDKPYYKEDVENLIEVGCRDAQGNGSTAWDRHIGWGLPDAASSLKFLHSPFRLRHLAEQTTVSALPSPSRTITGTGGLLNGVYFANPNSTSKFWTEDMFRSAVEYTISKWVPYNNANSDLIRVWGNHVTNDLSQGYDRLEDNYIDGVAQGVFDLPGVKLGATTIGDMSSNGYELRTYFYDCEEWQGGAHVFLPFDPRSKPVNFHYSLLDKDNTVGVESGIYGNDVEVSAPSIVRKDQIFTACIESRRGRKVNASMFDVLGSGIRGQSHHVSCTPGQTFVAFSTAGLSRGTVFLRFSSEGEKTIIRKILVY